MSADYDDSKETRQRLYEQTKAELLAKQTSNATNFDTAVLTLSSAFLGLSLAFIKDVIAPLSEAIWLPLLYLAWSSFCAAIISTVVSFMIGQASYRSLIAAAERYYIKGEAEAHGLSVSSADRIERLNNLNGFLFILGTVLLLAFTVFNFNRLANMPNTKVPPPPSEQRGQPTAPFQQVPSSTPAEPASSPPQAPSPPPAAPRAGT